MKKQIKELNLNIGVGLDVFPTSNRKFNHYVDYSGAPTGDADSNFSSLSNLVSKENETDEEEDYEMDDIILERRVYRDGNYQLCETLYNIGGEVNENIFKAAKSAILGIPGVDVLLGSALVANYGNNVAKAISSIAQGMSASGQLSVSEVTDGFLGDTHAFENLIQILKAGQPEDREAFKVGMDKLLDSLKSLLITTFQSYDSIPALIGTAAAGVGVIVTEGMSNAITSVLGFIGELIPLEQFIFEITSGRGKITTAILDFIQKWGRFTQAVITIGGSEVIRYFLKKLISLGGPLLEKVFDDPVEIFQRLGDLYKASQDKTGVERVAYAAFEKGGDKAFEKIKQYATGALTEHYSLIEMIDIDEADDYFPEIDYPTDGWVIVPKDTRYSAKIKPFNQMTIDLKYKH